MKDFHGNYLLAIFIFGCIHICCTLIFDWSTGFTELVCLLRGETRISRPLSWDFKGELSERLPNSVFSEQTWNVCWDVQSPLGSVDLSAADEETDLQLESCSVTAKTEWPLLPALVQLQRRSFDERWNHWGQIPFLSMLNSLWYASWIQQILLIRGRQQVEPAAKRWTLNPPVTVGKKKT